MKAAVGDRKCSNVLIYFRTILTNILTFNQKETKFYGSFQITSNTDRPNSILLYNLV